MKLINLHKKSINHRASIKDDTQCGCFYCKSIFPGNEISQWIDQEQTALCPKCGIDSVLPKDESFELNTELLEEMHEYWFERSEKIDNSATLLYFRI